MALPVSDQRCSSQITGQYSSYGLLSTDTSAHSDISMAARAYSQQLRALRSSTMSSTMTLHRAALLSPVLRSAQRCLSTQTKTMIQKAIEADPLVVFMKGTPQIPQCGFSRAVCQIMEVQGVPKEKLQTYNCLEDEELRQGIKEFSDWPTIPQVYLKGEFLGGCDIILGMHQSGELTTLLQDNGVVAKEQAQPTDGGAS